MDTFKIKIKTTFLKIIMNAYTFIMYQYTGLSLSVCKNIFLQKYFIQICFVLL